jgi:hypothetical protein
MDLRLEGDFHREFHMRVGIARVKKPHPYVNLARASSLCGELGHHIAEDCDWLPGMHTGLLSIRREVRPQKLSVWTTGPRTRQPVASALNLNPYGNLPGAANSTRQIGPPS